MRALDKLCSQQKFFDDYIHTKNQLQTPCHRPDLLIKWKHQDKRCSCSSSKKKSHFKKFKFKSSKKTPFNFSRKRRWRFFKKRAFLGKKKSDRCFVCNKRGHFSKDCPQKQKSAKLIQHIQIIFGLTLFDDDDVESLFSIDVEATLETLFAFQQEASDTDTDESEKDLIAIGSSGEEYY